MAISRGTSWTDRRIDAPDAIPPVDVHREDGALHVTRKFRGLTVDQAMRYLEHLGGERHGESVIEGDGWRAELSTAKVPVGPSYRLTEVTVTWSGD